MKKNPSILFVLLFLVFIIILAICNIKHNEDFFKIPLYNILNLFIAVVIAYYLTQRKNDERKLKEKAEELIDKIQNKLNSGQAYNITSSEDIAYVLLMHRSISNWLRLLEKLKDKLKFKNELAYINENFRSYKEFIGNHVSDLDYLSKSRKELENYILLMDNKLDEIKISMYS